MGWDQGGANDDVAAGAEDASRGDGVRRRPAGTVRGGWRGWELVSGEELLAFQARHGVGEFGMAVVLGISYRSWRVRRVTGMRMRYREAAKFRAIRAVTVRPHVVVVTYARRGLPPVHPGVAVAEVVRGVGSGVRPSAASRNRMRVAQLKRRRRERLEAMGHGERIEA